MVRSLADRTFQLSEVLPADLASGGPDGGGGPTLAVAFDAGVWGYDDWAPTLAAFRDDVAEAIRVDRAAGAFVVAQQRAMRVVLLKKPRLPPGYKGKRAWHLFAVGCPPADENPLKLQNCFVRRRRPTYVFVVTRTSFVGIGSSAGRGVLR